MTILPFSGKIVVKICPTFSKTSVDHADHFSGQQLGVWRQPKVFFEKSAPDLFFRKNKKSVSASLQWTFHK
jgi:hypothetical protein